MVPSVVICVFSTIPVRRPQAAVPYHQGMKTSYIFGAILASNVIGILVGGRSAKTGLAVVSAVLAVYGLVRIYG
jgi:hypothetical protein